MSKIQYVSTRGEPQQLDAAQAIARGLAGDGGLYVPTNFPRFSPNDFEHCDSLAETAACLIKPFVIGSVLQNEIERICQEAFSFDTPLVPLAIDASDRTLRVLELFHGPTAAFKDVGARFLAASMERIEQNSSERLRILVATSGDTGGAVAAAFHGREKVDVDVFYPAGQVSPRQEQQLTCWGDNVRAFKVEGRFDDCQHLVKSVFQDEALSNAHRFSSANSINLGRLLPQMAYYAHASMQLWRSTGQSSSYIVPTGNLGNALACVWARKAGLPIDRILLATNSNLTIPDYLSTAEWQPRQSIATLASAMDVGNPSNMERLRSMFSEIEQIRQQVSAISVNDDQIERQIKKDDNRYHQVWCPHTATALFAYDQLDSGQNSGHWVAVATAHPAKFEDVVEPLIGRVVDIPEALAKLLDLPTQVHSISAQLDELRHFYA